jgi:hypothetical protein
VALSLNGQCDEARIRAGRVLELTRNQPSILMLSWLAWGYHVCGTEDLYSAAKERLQGLVDDNPDSLNPGLAYYYAIEGNTAQLVKLFQAVADKKTPFTMFTQVFVPEYLGWSVNLESEEGKAYLALIDRLNYPPNDLNR